MPARRRIPFSQQCVCGQRVMPGKTLCRKCWQRSEQSFGVPGRSVARNPSAAPRTQQTESQQDRELEELSRCPECGTPFLGHSLDCSFFQLVDLTEEYAPADTREEL